MKSEKYSGHIDAIISFSVVLFIRNLVQFQHQKAIDSVQIHGFLLIWSILYRLSFFDILQIEDKKF